jgi:hypothetical protein
LPEERFLLQHPAVSNRFATGREVVVGLDEEPTGAAGGVKHGLTELRGGHIHHELHDWARSVELTAVARRVAHLTQHVFIETAEGMHLLAGGEVNAADLIDDISQEVSGLHAVGDALEHISDDILARLTGLGLERAQVGEEARAFLAVRPHGLVLRDELEQLFTGNTVGLGGPVAPAVRRLDGRTVLCPCQPGLALCGDLHVIKKL